MKAEPIKFLKMHDYAALESDVLLTSIYYCRTAPSVSELNLLQARIDWLKDNLTPNKTDKK